jgi:hypothetical protein
MLPRLRRIIPRAEAAPARSSHLAINHEAHDIFGGLNTLNPEARDIFVGLATWNPEAHEIFVGLAT